MPGPLRRPLPPLFLLGRESAALGRSLSLGFDALSPNLPGGERRIAPSSPLKAYYFLTVQVPESIGPEEEEISLSPLQVSFLLDNHFFES